MRQEWFHMNRRANNDVFERNKQQQQITVSSSTKEKVKIVYYRAEKKIKYSWKDWKTNPPGNN